MKTAAPHWCLHRAWSAPLALALVSAGIGWGAEALPGDRVREAAERGLARIQASQKLWYSRQGCDSCHHQLLPELVFRAARDHGLRFDEAAAADSAAHIFKLYSNFDRAVQFTHIVDPAFDNTYRLVAADAAGVRPNLATAAYARVHAQFQYADGHWATFDVRPPQSYSSFSATAITLRALQLYHHPSLAADTASRVARARQWLEQTKPRDTEDRTFQLFGLAWAGADRSTLSALAHALAGYQNNDGGWSSLDGRPSDVYSTGQVLAALTEAGGLSTSDPGWQRGLRFLIDAQQPDGSWHVVSRLHPPAPVSPPYFESGYPYGHDQFISVMGACWAIMALADALGPAAHVDPPLVREAMLANVEPWAETVLFGTAGQLRGLLDQKFDPNSATKGGTTALMMAVPDLEKMKLLVDDGAIINARSKTRYTALLVASAYPKSTPAIQYLLEQGATIRLPKGAGQPLFNATPMILAAMAGNAEAIPLLRRAGEDPEEKMTLLGFISVIPVLVPPSSGDAAVMRALLDAGGKVDYASPDGISLLSWAALSGRLEVARLLLERGADVNHVDQYGMTPLAYAASIDFGDSAMVELLLKAGANPKARIKEGLTALDLARSYKHSHLIAALAR